MKTFNSIWEIPARTKKKCRSHLGAALAWVASTKEACFYGNPLLKLVYCTCQASIGEMDLGHYNRSLDLRSWMPISEGRLKI